MTCPRHNNCAFDATEPDRCDVCHSLWSRICSCQCDRCTVREHHLAVHERDDAAAARQADQRAQRRGTALSATGEGSDLEPYLFGDDDDADLTKVDGRAIADVMAANERNVDPI